MNKLELLKSVRSEVKEPSAAQLASAYTNLQVAMLTEENAQHTASKAPTRTKPSWSSTRTSRFAGWTAVAAATMAFAVIGAQVFLPSAPAQAAELLQHAAHSAITSADLVVGEGQTLEVSMFEFITGTPDSPSGDPTPVTPEKDPALADMIGQIPTGSAAETLAHFDATYQGGSASSDEDNFVKIADILRTGHVPATTRAALYDALAIIPGVVATTNVSNALGEVGVGFSRAEAQRAGETAEILINPETGLVIGERTVSPSGEVTYLSALAYTVVDRS